MREWEWEGTWGGVPCCPRPWAQAETARDQLFLEYEPIDRIVMFSSACGKMRKTRTI